MKIIKKIKQVFCEHDYCYFGEEKLATKTFRNVHGRAQGQILTPTHAFECCICGKKMLIREMNKQETQDFRPYFRE